MIDLSRRKALKLGLAGAGPTVCRPTWALTEGTPDTDALSYGASPLGDLSYPAGFDHFIHRNPAAPKGGAVRLARIGAFDTLDTLRYPGRPPADMRVIYERSVVPSPDEPASYYGHLADGVAMSDDFTRIRFRLDPDARWHGLPVACRGQLNGCCGIATLPGSYALSGMKDAAVDASIDALSSASALEDAIAAGQQFDARLRGSFAYLPLWRDGQTRIA